jgi:hypothetical protein
MYNWNIDITLFRSKKKRIWWKLNQLINFGLGGEKVNLRLVKKYWDKLFLDPKRKRFLEFLIWGRLS